MSDLTNLIDDRYIIIIKNKKIKNKIVKKKKNYSRDFIGWLNGN